MRHRAAPLLLSLLVAPLQAAAAPPVSHYPLHWFVVKQAEAPDRDFAYYTQEIQQASAEADALLQGVQAPAPTDVACCVSIDVLQIDEIDASELATVDQDSDFATMMRLCGSGRCAFLVDSITLARCGVGAVACSDFPYCNQVLDPLIVIISLEAVEGGYFGHLVAHEVGHTACLAHDSSNPCNLMDLAVVPGTLQGCLNSAGCDHYHQHGAPGADTCECHTDQQEAVADGALCTEHGDVGACASGVCAAAPEPGAAPLALAALAGLVGGARRRRCWQPACDLC